MAKKILEKFPVDKAYEREKDWRRGLMEKLKFWNWDFHWIDFSFFGVTVLVVLSAVALAHAAEFLSALFPYFTDIKASEFVSVCITVFYSIWGAKVFSRRKVLWEKIPLPVVYFVLLMLCWYSLRDSLNTITHRLNNGVGFASVYESRAELNVFIDFLKLARDTVLAFAIQITTILFIRFLVVGVKAFLTEERKSYFRKGKKT